MKKQDFETTIVVDNTPEEVYNAINNVHDWWHGEIEGSAKKLNDEFDYRFPEQHFSKQKVVELIPGKKVVWLVTDSDLKFENHDEWTGTKLIFEISPSGNKTQVKFTHEGLNPSFQCYDDCSWGWTQLIQESLSSFIATGKGVKVFE